MTKMIFTEALKMQLKWPYERKAIMPNLYNEPFDLMESIVHVGYKNAYQLVLKWSFLAYLDEAACQAEAQTNCIREMNRVVYGDFIQALIEVKDCIKYGNEKNALSILNHIISEITQTFGREDD